MEAILVESMTDLKKRSSINGYAEFFIVLGGGICHSSKRIRYYTETKVFDIHNEIDDTWQENITEEDLHKYTMIPEAIEKNAFFYTGFQLQGLK